MKRSFVNFFISETSRTHWIQGHMSKGQGHTGFCCFCSVRETAFTRGQYLALSKAWPSCLCGLVCVRGQICVVQNCVLAGREFISPESLRYSQCSAGTRHARASATGPSSGF